MLDGNADGVGGGDFVRMFTVVPPQADLNLKVAIDNPTPIENGPVQFTVTLDDTAGPQAARGVQVADLVPAGLTLANVTPAPGTSYNSVSGIWSVPNLAQGASVSLVLNATVNSHTLGQTISDTAAVTASGVTDPNLSNNSASAAVTVAPSADLTISQTLDDTKPIGGQVIHYTFTLANPTGPENSSGASVRVQLPVAATLVSATPGAGTSYDSSTGMWTIAGLPVGSSASLVIAVQVNSGVMNQTLVSTAIINSAAQANLNVSNLSSTLGVVVQPGAHLIVAQSVDNATPAVGETVRYTVTVNNSGPDDAGNVLLRDTLPDGLDIVDFGETSGTFSPGSVTGAGDPDASGPPAWFITDLPAGAIATLVFDASIDSDKVGQTLINEVAISQLSAQDKEPNDGMIAASVVVGAPVAISATGITETAVQGETFTASMATFTINDPNAAATDFTATIDWGDGSTAAPDVTGGAVVSEAGGGFVVTGTHAFTADSSDIPVTVRISDAHDGATATVQSTAIVTSSPFVISATGITETAVQGETFTASMATFTINDLNAVATDFMATIDWGDGSTAAPDVTGGTVVSEAGGGFVVVGTHAFTVASSDIPITVRTSDAHDGATATVQSTAIVSPAPVEISASGTTVTGTQGRTFFEPVASFTITDPNAVASDFTATIDWGDGATSSGSVAATNGGFQVIGSHIYSGVASHQVIITIRDDAVGIQTQVTTNSNIGDVNALYVAAVYLDVLGRAPDAGGLAFWDHLLDSGTAVSSVAASIAHSDEYYIDYVIRPAYLKLLDRASEVGGEIYWTGQMDAGVTDQQLEADLVSSPEFYANAGGTNPAWVDAIYELLLGRAPDSNGESYWASQLAAGQTLNQVAEGIAGSQENNTQLINDDYFHYLGRAADSGGLAYWLQQFADGQTNEDVIAGFTGSTEYYNEHTS
jgi:uncharacterized repeat protein (TIGR01451 family)